MRNLYYRLPHKRTVNSKADPSPIYKYGAQLTSNGVDKADDKVKDRLQWWIDHEADYPTLAKMAFDFFSIPAMSSECERVFSQSKKTITDERNRLGTNTVAAIECQKHLLRSGLLDV